jgi:hypothetical protein
VHNEPEAAHLSGGDVLDPRAHAARVALPRAIRAGIFFVSGSLALELRLEAAALQTRVKDTDTADPAPEASSIRTICPTEKPLALVTSTDAAP